MGFFDKIREAVGEAVGEVVTTVQNNFVPLSDATERLYYEIAYGLLSSVKDTSFGGVVSFNGIKKYVEFHLGEPCNADTLQKALANFDYSDCSRFCGLNSESALRAMSTVQGFTPQKIEKLIAINKELEEKKAYRCSEEEALKICYEAELSGIPEEFDKVLAVVASSKVKFFREGLDRIEREYEPVIGKELYRHTIRALTKTAFLEGNAVVERVLFATLDQVLWKEKSTFGVASVVVRALHFEINGSNRETYQTIGNAESSAFVLNNPHFVANINEHPYDREKYIKDYVGSISKVSPFRCSTIATYWMPRCDEDPYYADAVCNLYWKSVAGKHENDSQDPNEIYDMIWEYINT